MTTAKNKVEEVDEYLILRQIELEAEIKLLRSRGTQDALDLAKKKEKTLARLSAKGATIEDDDEVCVLDDSRGKRAILAFQIRELRKKGTPEALKKADEKQIELTRIYKRRKELGLVDL